jgi:hypothetical protein
MENQSGCKIQAIRFDNEKEYTSSKFNIFYEDAGIEHQLTTLYTLEQNRVSERRIRYIMKMVRCMLHEKGLSKEF